MRTTRERSYRDPVHDFITLSDSLLLDLIDTPEFQRLRRIRQLGAAYGTYHGAEHSRFGHALGVLWVMHKVLRRLGNLGVVIDAPTATLAYCAALLHDVGHSPFSHALENHLTPGRDHEDWTRAIILGNTRIHAVLAAYDAALPAAVAAVLAGTWDGPRFVRSLVSSQLDVDRMDYLIRDSLYTGVTYGRFDLERLINTLTVVDDEIVLMAKGIVAAEEYILARYFMYWQVYLHKTTRGQEHVMRAAWRRALDLHKEGRLDQADVPRPIRPFLEGSVSLDAYLRVDDFDWISAIKVWLDHPDGVLSDLCRRFLHRDLLGTLFKVPHETLSLEPLGDARRILRASGWDPDYYLVVDRTTDVAYDYYTTEPGEEERKEPIRALDERGTPREIATLSHTIAAVATRRKVAANLYVPKECLAKVRRLFTPGAAIS